MGERSRAPPSPRPRPRRPQAPGSEALRWGAPSLAAGLLVLLVTSGALGGPGPAVGARAPTAGSGERALRAAGAGPSVGFGRTVLVEAFVGDWCHYCVAESQALYRIGQNTSPGAVAIVELHVCAYATGSGPCLDPYVPTDGTATERGAFYDVCGYPDIFFDGSTSICGAPNNVSAVEAQYDSAIGNASAEPANLSIAQGAFYRNGVATDEVAIDPGVTGTFNLVSYLVEYIGRTNVSYDGENHAVGWVVRETLANRPVALTAGSPINLTVGGALNASWNAYNLSVITLVQDNATRAIENANESRVVNWTAFRSAIAFDEAGLPTGHGWSVLLNGSRLNSTSGTVDFGSLPLGSYGFTVGAPGYTATPASGVVDLTGVPAAVSISFTPSPPATFAVTFQESGLPTGTSWGVVLGNASSTNASAQLTFFEPNGSYSAVVLPLPDYVPAAPGPVVVNGSAVIVPVAFHLETYPVVFVEFGLPAGTNWSVTVSNASTGFNETQSTTSNSLTFFLPNGSFAIRFGLPSGYVGNATSTNLTVDGSALVGPAVDAHAPPAGTTASPPRAPAASDALPAPLWFALGGAVCLAVAFGSLSAYRRFRGPPPGPDP